MAKVTNWYTMNNKLGVNPNEVVVISSTSFPEYPAPPAKLGDRVQGNNGSEWCYVQASATVNRGYLVAIDANFKCAPLTSALSIAGLYTFGIAQFQATLANSSEFFWALMKVAQGATVIVDASSSVGNAGAALYVGGSTPGTVMVTAVTNRLNGLIAITSISSGNSLEVGMFSYIIPGLAVSMFPSSV